MDEHFYYLHTNGELIHKRLYPDPSDFVRRIWTLDLSRRETAWNLLFEATALGANQTRIKELAAKWKCDFDDLGEYVIRSKGQPTPERWKGMQDFSLFVFNLNINIAMDFASANNRWPKFEEVNAKAVVTT